MRAQIGQLAEVLSQDVQKASMRYIETFAAARAHRIRCCNNGTSLTGLLQPSKDWRPTTVHGHKISGADKLCLTDTELSPVSAGKDEMGGLIMHIVFGSSTRDFSILRSAHGRLFWFGRAMASTTARRALSLGLVLTLARTATSRGKVGVGGSHNELSQTSQRERGATTRSFSTLTTARFRNAAGEEGLGLLAVASSRQMTKQLRKTRNVQVMLSLDRIAVEMRSVRQKSEEMMK